MALLVVNGGMAIFIKRYDYHFCYALVNYGRSTCLERRRAATSENDCPVDAAILWTFSTASSGISNSIRLGNFLGFRRNTLSV